MGEEDRLAALAERRQELRVTAAEAFDLRVLINEDYGLCPRVSPDFSTSARQKNTGQKAPCSKRNVPGQSRLHS